MSPLLYIFILFKLCVCYYPVPVVEINLDQPASTRWNSAIDAVLARHTWNETFGAIFAEANNSLYNQIPPSDYSIFTNAIKQNWPENYEELLGISAHFSTYNQVVTIEYLSLWVYFHELSHLPSQSRYNNRACTGILIMDENNNIFHGRNMDQQFKQGRNLTLSISFIKDNKQIFAALDWYWFTSGIVTAQKNQILSIQENFKFETQQYSSIINMVKEGRIPQVFLFREILSMNDISFIKCCNIISSIPLISPMYAIVGGIEGVHDGAIITRWINSSILLDFANITQHSTGNYNNYNPTYYMVQTNYDLWIQDPSNDPRRTMAETMLASWNRSIDSKLLSIGSNLQAIMSSYKVHNQDTFYTGIFSAAHNLFLGYIREAIVSVSVSV